MNPWTWFKAKAGGLSTLDDTPHAIAMGVASGMFYGFVPLLGLKTLLALITARLFRGNLVAAAVAVTLHDILLPILPLMLRWEYELGYWLFNHPHEFPQNLHLHEARVADWLHWSTFLSVGRPLLVGSIIVALPAAVISYFLVKTLLQRSRARRAVPLISELTDE